MTATTTIPDPGRDGLALQRLLAWLSPSFPVGGFAYSHGLEPAVEAGVVRDAETLFDWIEGLVEGGTARGDAVLLSVCHAATVARDGKVARSAAELASVLFGAPELRLESIGQGEAFLRTVRAGWPSASLDRACTAVEGLPIAYPIAVGLAAASLGVGRHETLVAFLHGFATNAVSAAIRLGVIGQTAGQVTLARLEPRVSETARATLDATLDDAGSAAVAVELLVMSHETQTTRLFRS